VPDPVRERGKRRIVLHGEIGSAASMPSGCSFHPRCFRARLVAAEPGIPVEDFRGESLPAACMHRVPGFATPHGDQVAACHFAHWQDGAEAPRAPERATEPA
jgi:oligopeptide transport system ATP-binding protein